MPRKKKSPPQEQKPDHQVPVYLVKLEFKISPSDLSLAWMYMTQQVEEVPPRIEALVEEHWDLLDRLLKNEWKMQERLGIH